MLIGKAPVSAETIELLSSALKHMQWADKLKEGS
jgi:hypothetical protein